MTASPYRPEFEAALRLFARLSEAMVARGLRRPILVGGAAATMASKFYPEPDEVASDAADGWTGRRIDMAEFGRSLAARKAELDLPNPPRNTGRNRTSSKRALLKAIEERGGKW